MIPNLTILPFRANWASPVTLKSSFATNIKRESIPGDQTRDSGRDFGQRSIRFTLLLDQATRRAWDAFREVNPPGTILGIPLWCEEGITLTADAAIGATTLNVTETNNIDWRTEAVLISAVVGPAALPATEAFKIASVTSGGITLSTPLQSAFEAGDEVLPLMRGYQIEDYAENTLSPETSEIELVFVEDLSTLHAPSFPNAPAVPSFLSLPVLPLVAEWSEPPKSAIGQGTHIVASGFNAQAFATLRQYVRQRISHRVGLDGRADRALLWQFFHDRRGRWDRFWLPSVKNELKLRADVAASDTTLQLANFADFSSRYSLGGNLRRAIFITDGFNWWIRQIINLSGGTNRVTIDSALGGNGVSAGGCQIGLLTLVQFATDDIEIECETPLIARATLTFTELEAEYAEVITPGTAHGTITGMELVGA